jgi:hypothetical protein
MNTLINIDIELLRIQRDYLLTLSPNDNIDGIINLLDSILDELEGY